MRPYHPITPNVVHGRARQALRHVLDWVPFHKSVSVDDLLDLLLLMAACTASLFGTVRRFFSFSHQTGSLAVKANLPGRKNIDRLTRGLVNALYDVMALSRQDRWRRWTVAKGVIDLHTQYHRRKWVRMFLEALGIEAGLKQTEFAFWIYCVN